jgi:hypothetical protein
MTIPTLRCLEVKLIQMTTKILVIEVFQVSYLPISFRRRCCVILGLFTYLLALADAPQEIDPDDDQNPGDRGVPGILSAHFV